MAASRKAASVGLMSSVSGQIPSPAKSAFAPHRSTMSEKNSTNMEGFAAPLSSLLFLSQALRRIREPMNTLTHGAGAVLSVIGLILLIRTAIDPLRGWHLVSYTIYGAAMVMVYTASTVFHGLNISEQVFIRLRKIDHIMIFIFMAGSYAPFCFVPFRGTFGWLLFTGIWAIAFCGIIFKIYWIHAPKWLCLMIYVCASCFAFVATGPILTILQPGAIFWLITGGILYAIGAVFYAMEDPEAAHGLFGCHEIFHILVMLGTGAHFWVVYWYVNQFS